MSIEECWPELTADTQQWLVEHNGEPLSASVRAEIVAVNDGDLDPSWWSRETTEGHSELTDEAIDWIETWANNEDPGE